MSKPHDDFCGLLAIGVYPQIKIGNDLVESLEEKRNPPSARRLGCHSTCALAACSSLQVVEGLAASRLCTAAGFDRKGVL